RAEARVFSAEVVVTRPAQATCPPLSPKDCLCPSALPPTMNLTEQGTRTVARTPHLNLPPASTGLPRRPRSRAATDLRARPPQRSGARPPPRTPSRDRDFMTAVAERDGHRTVTYALLWAGVFAALTVVAVFKAFTEERLRRRWRRWLTRHLIDRYLA